MIFITIALFALIWPFIRRIPVIGKPVSWVLATYFAIRSVGPVFSLIGKGCRYALVAYALVVGQGQ